MSLRVMMAEGDPRFGLYKGDLLEVVPYRLDPSKLAVIRRVHDGFDPECNVYRSQVTPVAGATHE